MALNGNKVNLPKSITITFRDKFKIRHMMEREPLLFHIMLKQGFTWFTLASNTPLETVQVNIDTFSEWLVTYDLAVVFSMESSLGNFLRML